ncbi:hypothetical protein L1987_51643 [Smallanthus sonchifolius]|uniref:Uncharacterized protein n=1 Tax=Smallanthus sonchifolius TaxID=185202 RepID=A0ACB9ES09_9ASTR|nr:hypothetical protein L1987_51643 [Smallanthus sonchifolius]
MAYKMRTSNNLPFFAKLFMHTLSMTLLIIIMITSFQTMGLEPVPSPEPELPHTQPSKPEFLQAQSSEPDFPQPHEPEFPQAQPYKPEFPQPSKPEFPQPSESEFPQAQPYKPEFPQPSEPDFPQAQPYEPQFPRSSEPDFPQAQPFKHVVFQPDDYMLDYGDWFGPPNSGGRPDSGPIPHAEVDDEVEDIYFDDIDLQA